MEYQMNEINLLISVALRGITDAASALKIENRKRKPSGFQDT